MSWETEMFHDYVTVITVNWISPITQPLRGGWIVVTKIETGPRDWILSLRSQCAKTHRKNFNFFSRSKPITCPLRFSITYVNRKKMFYLNILRKTQDPRANRKHISSLVLSLCFSSGFTEKVLWVLSEYSEYSTRTPLSGVLTTVSLWYLLHTRTVFYDTVFVCFPEDCLLPLLCNSSELFFLKDENRRRKTVWTPFTCGSRSNSKCCRIFAVQAK